MQKLDKVAIIAVALILVLGVVYTLVGADPAKTLATKITEAAEKIEETSDAQSSLRASVPTPFDERIDALFESPSTSGFPEWTFYRRPTSYRETVVVEVLPPEHSEGSICKVEAVREKPNRLFHRISGVCAEVVRATVTEQVIEAAIVDDSGELTWTEVARVPHSGNGDVFTAEIGGAEGLEQGQVYTYRFRSTAESTSAKDFPGGKTNSRTTEIDGQVLFPQNEVWQARRANGPTASASGTIPGSATLSRYRWDWDAMKVDHDQNPNSIERDETSLAFPDSPYYVYQVRTDKNPIEVHMRNPADRRDRFVLLVGVPIQTLTPDPWEATSGPCLGGGEDEDDNASSGGSSDPDVDIPADDDDDDSGGGGGLFGDD